MTLFQCLARPFRYLQDLLLILDKFGFSCYKKVMQSYLEATKAWTVHLFITSGGLPSEAYYALTGAPTFFYSLIDSKALS
jgi:hypothetical protein